MTVISKELFYQKVTGSDITCATAHFWEEDCLKKHFSWFWMKTIITGCGKFYVPIYILKLILSYKKAKNKEFLQGLMISYARSTFYGIVLAQIIIGTLCAARALFGWNYYGVLFLPGFMSGLSLLVESEENRIANSIIFFNAAVETILNKLRMSITGETVMFMTISGILMYALESRKSNFPFLYLWFYTPQKRKSDTTVADGDVCNHEESCYEYAKQAFMKFCGLGYAVNVVRRLIPRMGKIVSKPRLVMDLLVNKTNFKFGLFIGSYVGLYRTLSCYMNRKPTISQGLRSLIAGILSGVTYSICPTLQVLVIGITTLLQIIYHYIAKQLNITNNFWLRQFLFMLSNGYLLHNKMFFPKDCSPYYSNVIDSATNNVAMDIYRTLMRVLGML